MNKLIELKNLTKNFDDQQVLRGINLDIYENEFLTLLGPSGCGKTTTLRIIAGFEEPSGGEVLFNGIEISKLPPYKREVNTVFQKYALFPHVKVNGKWEALFFRKKTVVTLSKHLLTTVVFIPRIIWNLQLCRQETEEI